MARVIYAPGQLPLHGSIGNLTFQSNVSGNILREKRWDPEISSQKQLIFQSLFKSLTVLWNNLDAQNRADWNWFASTYSHNTIWGNITQPSGYMWFMSCQLNNSICGAELDMTIPLYWFPAEFPAFTIDAGSDHLNIVIDPALQNNYLFNVIYATMPLRVSVANLKNKNYLVKVDQSLNFSTIDILSAYQDCFNLNWSDVFQSGTFSILFRIRRIDGESQTSSFWTNYLYTK
jgi:hypothetical protein